MLIKEHSSFHSCSNILVLNTLYKRESRFSGMGHQTAFWGQLCPMYTHYHSINWTMKHVDYMFIGITRVGIIFTFCIALVSLTCQC